MKKLSIEHAQKLAISKNGICLSEIYVNSSSPLQWKCLECEYVWFAKYNTVQNGAWCPDCGGTRKYTQQEIEGFISERGGTCLSKYENSRDKLKILCYHEHEFYKSWNKIKAGQWCSLCSKSISERICREYFEQIFGFKFPSVRPKWLLGDKNYPLELDGYCADLGIAFEHNGSRHYRQLPQFTTEQFIDIVENDKCKLKLCNDIGVKLIIIPELFSKTKICDLKKHIVQECIELGISLPHNFNEINIDINKLYFNRPIMKQNNTILPNNSKYNYDDVVKIVKSKNGKCLSDYYNTYQMKFMCEKGHIWETTPGNIIRDNNWCQQCHLIDNVSVSNILTQDILVQECYVSTSFQQIAEKYDVTQATVRIYFKKFGIIPNFKRKTRSDSLANVFTKDVLLEECKNLNVYEISNKYNVSVDTIQRYCKLYGLKPVRKKPTNYVVYKKENS